MLRWRCMRRRILGRAFHSTGSLYELQHHEAKSEASRIKTEAAVGNSDDSAAAVDAAFFQWCAQTAGMQTKKLTIDTSMPLAATVRVPNWNQSVYDMLDPRKDAPHANQRDLQASLHIAPSPISSAILDESASAGAVLASVPYTSAVVNAETVRGKQSYALQAITDETEKDPSSFPRTPLVMPSVNIMLSVLQHPRLRRLLQKAVRRRLNSRRAALHRSSRAILRAALRARPLDGTESQVFWLSCFVACVLRQQRVAKAARLPQLSTYYDSYINKRLFYSTAPSPFVYLAAAAPSSATIATIRDALRRAASRSSSNTASEHEQERVKRLLYVTPIGQSANQLSSGDKSPPPNVVQEAGEFAAAALLEYPALRDGIVEETSERAAKYYRVLTEAENRLKHGEGAPKGNPDSPAAARGRRIRESLKMRDRQLRAAQLALHDGLTDIYRDTHEQLCLAHVLLQLYNAAKRVERRRRSRLWNLLNHKRVETVVPSRLPFRESVLIPSLDELWNAHLLVMKKAVFLPLHCATSAPLDLSEFLAQLEERSMSMNGASSTNNASVPPLLPSLIPVVEMFSADSSISGSKLRSASTTTDYSAHSREAASAAAQAEYVKLLESIAGSARLIRDGGTGDKGKEDAALSSTELQDGTAPLPNALLYTCIASTFASDSMRTDGNAVAAFQATPTRRRVMPVESTQLSARRVAVCATAPIKRGQRVRIPYGGDGGNTPDDVKDERIP